MNNNLKRFLYSTAAVFILILSIFSNSCFAQGVLSEADLKSKYQENKVKILIVPGHDDESKTGTSFAGLYERDLNLQLAKGIYKLFKKDSHFSVFITRDNNGYLPQFSDYFKNESADIKSFSEKYKQIMADLMANGTLKKQTDGIDHLTVDGDYAMRLYGINKWANENNIDIIIHVHFNDYPGRPAKQTGEYSGFSVYAPESQLVNSDISQNIARSVSLELNKIQSVSDYQPEHSSVVDDQELIAVGANSTLGAAALLIEYGYIYESQIINKKMRVLMFPEYAYKTYSGIVKFFNPDYKINKCDSVLLPHKFINDLYFGMRNNTEVANLQTALVCSGLYIGPITGNFLNYTRQAVIDFQKKHNFTNIPNTGYVGSYTRKVLNELYSK